MAPCLSCCCRSSARSSGSGPPYLLGRALTGICAGSSSNAHPDTKFGDLWHEGGSCTEASNIRAETSTHYVWTAFVQGPRVGSNASVVPSRKGLEMPEALTKGQGYKWWVGQHVPPPPLSDHSEQRLPASQGKVLAEACSVFRVS